MTLRISGAREHNLKNIDLDLPHNKLICIAGVSGSGKSSLAFDTLYAEGMRRFLESLSVRLRGLKQLARPDFDHIDGLGPTLGISQQTAHFTTVGTHTEIHHLLRLLAKKLAPPPLSQAQIAGEIIKNFDSKIQILVPLPSAENLQQMGYIRIRHNGKIIDLTEEKAPKGAVEVVVDRLKTDSRERLADSLRTAFSLASTILVADSHHEIAFTEGEKQDYPIDHLLDLSVVDLLDHLNGLNEIEVTPRIRSRLECLVKLGLPYLTMNREGNTLSVGEAQRVQLTAQIGSNLSGVLYILDEPSRGLHWQEVSKLTKTLKELRDNGNTVIIVEHHPLLIQQADHLVELGPGAGIHGGQLIYQGKPRTHASKLLPHTPRDTKDFLEVTLTQNNLHNFSCAIPLNSLVGICGPSGAGKSTLLDALDGLHITQRRAGTSRRATPATYIGIMDELRTLFASTPLAKARGYTPSHFSLNKKGGRCEQCEGQGQIRIKLDPLPDSYAPCDLCQGDRYNFETLQVTWKGHSLADILKMTAQEAWDTLGTLPKLADRLHLMQQLGLDYLTLGQNFTTLSGGELQRLKLITQLAKRGKHLYLLDEPTTGLSSTDIAKLAAILQRLVDSGNSVIIIEHNLEILKQCDYLIELDEGRLVYEGKPENIGETATGCAMRTLLP